MSLADVIQRATAGIVPKLIGPEGFARSTVTTTRYEKTRDAAARPSREPSNPVSGAVWFVREISGGRAQRVFGASSIATAEAQVPLGTDVEEDDVVEITAGDLVGSVYEVDQKRVDAIGSRIVLALGPTGQESDT